MRRLNPGAVHQPTGKYSLVSLVPSTVDLIWISGQMGRDQDGGFARGVHKQTIQALENVSTVVGALGLSVLDIVSFRSYLTRRRGLDAFRAARDGVMTRWYGDLLSPGNTLLVVDKLAHARALVEIEAVVGGTAVE